MRNNTQPNAALAKRAMPPIPDDWAHKVPFLSIDEAAAMAKVSRRTIHDWLNRKLFKSTRPIASGSGRRLICSKSFADFIGVAA